MSPFQKGKKTALAMTAIVDDTTDVSVSTAGLSLEDAKYLQKYTYTLHLQAQSSDPTGVPVESRGRGSCDAY